MSTQLLKYLSGKITEIRVRTADDLSLGGAKDHGEYKYAAGIIRGLDLVTNIIIETADKMKEDGDAD